MSTSTKALLLQDYLCSGFKDLGLWADKQMKQYDNMSYRLIITKAVNAMGDEVGGTAQSGNKKDLEELVKVIGLKGDYNIREIDCQYEFFMLLAEIRDDFKARKFTRAKPRAMAEKG